MGLIYYAIRVPNSGYMGRSISQYLAIDTNDIWPNNNYLPKKVLHFAK